MNKKLIVSQLNLLLEAADENAGDAGGSYNQAMPELLRQIKDTLCVIGIDDYEIFETHNRNYYTPYLIKIKQN